MKDTILKLTLGIILTACILFTADSFGYNRGYEADREPTSDLFWIDNDRVHKDSIIDCSPIYNDNIEIIGSWIRVSYEDTTIHIECIDTNDYEWQEYRDSWLMAFKEGAL